MNSDSKVVYLCGAGGKGNIGAEAITLAIIKLFQRRYGQVRFLVSAWYPDRMREVLSRIPGDFSILRQESLLGNPRSIAQADFFVICGDVSFSESVVSFLPLYYAMRTATANLVGRNVLFLGIEAEKLSRFSNLLGLRWLADRQSNVVVLRNEESLFNVSRIPMRRARLLLGCEPTLTLEKDDVLGFDCPDRCLAPSKLRVGFGIRDYFTMPFKVQLLSGKLRRRDMPTGEGNGIMRRVVEFTAEIADFMAQRYDAQIIFVPHHYLPEKERVIRPDAEVAKTIIERMQVAKDVVVMEDCLHPFTVINIYKELDVVFSMRHHANAFGFWNHVPTFGYDIHPKLRAFFNQIGRGDMLLDPCATDMSEVYAKIDRAVRKRESLSRELNASLEVLVRQMNASLDVALRSAKCESPFT